MCISEGFIGPFEGRKLPLYRRAYNTALAVMFFWRGGVRLSQVLQYNYVRIPTVMLCDALMTAQRNRSLCGDATRINLRSLLNGSRLAAIIVRGRGEESSSKPWKLAGITSCATRACTWVGGCCGGT